MPVVPKPSLLCLLLWLAMYKPIQKYQSKKTMKILPAKSADHNMEEKFLCKPQEKKSSVPSHLPRSELPLPRVAVY